MEIVKDALVRPGTYAPNPRRVPGPDGLLELMRPFDSTTKNMRARRYDGVESASYMPEISLGRLEQPHRADLLGTHPLYVVWSYHTPIAWVDEFYRVFIPDHRYSHTTSVHQGMCQAWLAGRDGMVWMGRKPNLAPDDDPWGRWLPSSEYSKSCESEVGRWV